MRWGGTTPRVRSCAGRSSRPGPTGPPLSLSAGRRRDARSFRGRGDVFVCDGFVGNVAIKTMEGMATALGQFLKEEIAKSLMAKVGALLAERALRSVKDRLGYEGEGGGPPPGRGGGGV